MNDKEVIDAFVNGGTRGAFGSTVHVEADVLILDGWWHAMLRISPDVFIMRNEELPSETTLLEDAAAAFAARGLRCVGEDHPLIAPITYTTISLGIVGWTVWATDPAAADAAFEARLGAGAETAFVAAEDGEFGMESALGFSAELGGARRLGGLPASVILTVGVDPARADELALVFPDCRLETRTFEEMPPEACGNLIPNLILVNATEQLGRDWVMEVRSSACGRFLPVLGVVREGGPPLGSDGALDADGPVTGWIETLRAMLPE
ncbi:MAG: hypothetical protein ABIW46_07395 [Acidimicrobiales bacterium]